MSTALSTICDDMNNWINTNGKLLSSTNKGGFLNQWHDLDNDFWISVFRDARAVMDTTRHSLPSWLEEDMTWLENHINKYGEHHVNLLNPPQSDTREMPKRLTEHSTGRSVKSVLWRLLMNLRERLYNPAMNIDLPNDDTSIGKLNPTTFESLFEKTR